MKVVQGQTLLYSVESDGPDDKALSKLNNLKVRMRVLVSNIAAIDEAIDVSKYVLKYNCRLPYTKHDLNLMRNVEEQVLTWFVYISDGSDPITVYVNYIEYLDRMENKLRNDDE